MHGHRRSLITIVACLVLLACLQVRPASAQGTPWIAEPETGSISVTFANQRATEFFRADTATKGPPRRDRCTPVAEHAVVRRQLRLHGCRRHRHSIGLGRSFLPGPVGPTPKESFSGLGDSNIAVTWRVVDEYVGNAPSVAIRGALIAAGNYETGYINSLGDGGHGFEGSVIAGKFWRHAGFSTELGYRYRSSTQINEMAVGGTTGEVDVPADVFFNLSGFFPLNDVLTLGVDYQMVNARDGIDIGGPGFSPSRFPGLEEDAHIVGGRLLANITDAISLNVFAGQVVAGRNTAKSRLIGVGATFAFGGGGVGL